MKIHNIRKEMKALESQDKGAGEEERIGLARIMCILQKKIRKRSGKLASSQEEIDQHLTQTYSDPYKVYKTCPKLLLRLWKILQIFWRKGKIPEQWRVAEGVWIPKEENSTQLDQFCIISLLCVEAKIFFSAISKSLWTYLTKNTYIDTSVQKGGV
ncbi:hypothetical protein AOLI_G00231220 [Acnodon oligacanthus]